jgi:pimeloyl-ACP methyl ester carboxylesterase
VSQSLVAELRTIKQPTFIVNGSNDIMVPTIRLLDMLQHIPNAQLIVYPDAGHAAHYQYPELFLKHSRCSWICTRTPAGTRSIPVAGPAVRI